MFQPYFETRVKGSMEIVGAFPKCDETLSGRPSPSWIRFSDNCPAYHDYKYAGAAPSVAGKRRDLRPVLLTTHDFECA